MTTTENDASVEQDHNGISADLRELVEEMLDSRPEFRVIRDVAMHGQCSPVGTLAIVLAMVGAATPCWFVLPPAIGVEPAPLGLFVAQMGISGAGKKLTFDAARRAVHFSGGQANGTASNPAAYGRVAIEGIGSGEGLVTSFVANLPKRDAMDVVIKPVVLERVRLAYGMVIKVSEVTELEAKGSRNGATLMSYLLQLWSGEDIRTNNRSAAMSDHLPAGDYSASMVVGVQPSNAHVLLSHAGTGLPQRFLAVPVREDWQPVMEGELPVQHRWVWPVREKQFRLDPFIRCEGQPRVFMEVPAEVIAELRANREHYDSDPELGGHLGQTRYRLAGDFAVLAQRRNMTYSTEDGEWSDWQCAELMMQVSAAVWARAQAVLDEAAMQVGAAAGRIDAARATSKTDAVVQVDRVANRIEAHMRRSDVGGFLTATDLSRFLGRDRPFKDLAISQLVARNRVVAAPAKGGFLFIGQDAPGVTRIA